MRDFPELTFVLNGGIQSLGEAAGHMNRDSGFQFNCEEDPSQSELLPPVHGVMIGRVAYSNPLQFATADSTFHNMRDPGFTRRQIMENYIDYCEWAQSELGPRRNVTHGHNRQMITTSVLINSMRNLICGIPHVHKFRTALNDIYMAKIKGLNATPNPSCREMVRHLLVVVVCVSAYNTAFLCCSFRRSRVPWRC